REVGTQLRSVIDAGLPKASGTMWQGQPVWKIGTTPVALLKAYASYVTFGLFRGQAVSDPSGRLEANAREMAAVKLPPAADSAPASSTDWRHQGRALAESAA